MSFLEEQYDRLAQWLGHIIANIKKAYSPLEDLRVIFICLIAIAFVLLYLDQGKDVIRTLVDGANATMSNWSIAPDSGPSILRWNAFLLACIWSGINAWYWANLLYKTKADRTQ